MGINSFYRLEWDGFCYTLRSNIDSYSNTSCILGGEDGKYILRNEHVFIKKERRIMFGNWQAGWSAQEPFLPYVLDKLVYHPLSVYKIYIVHWVESDFLKGLIND